MQPGGMFRAVGLTVREYMRAAFGSPTALLADQVTGGPAWVDTDRFEIIAKVANVASLSEPNQQVLTMLRGLLAERFKLAVHTESRQLPMYDLVVAADDGRLGPRLRRPADTCIPIMAMQVTPDISRMCGVRRWGLGVLGGVGSMGWLAGILSQNPAVARVVRDRTGLAGDFDFDLEFQVNEQAGGDLRPSLFTSLREQLGLKLVPTKGPVDVLVIDHAEKPECLIGLPAQDSGGKQ